MTYHKLKFFVSVFAVFLGASLFAQGHYEGETLPTFLGKDSGSSELKALENNFECLMINENHYQSKFGIELYLKDGLLTEIDLYKNSKAYGSYTAKLPHGISFGMTEVQVIGLLGKPGVEYNSGYCEFDYRSYVLSCWFEGDGHLSQVGISANTGH